MDPIVSKIRELAERHGKLQIIQFTTRDVFKHVRIMYVSQDAGGWLRYSMSSSSGTPCGMDNQHISKKPVRMSARGLVQTAAEIEHWLTLEGYTVEDRHVFSPDA